MSSNNKILFCSRKTRLLRGLNLHIPKELSNIVLSNLTFIEYSTDENNYFRWKGFFTSGGSWLSGTAARFHDRKILKLYTPDLPENLDAKNLKSIIDILSTQNCYK